jgi:hypothetical protein
MQYAFPEGTMDPDLIQDILRRDWLSPQNAILLAGISYAWLRLLGERGQVATLQTPLGRLYNRVDIERLRRQREQAGGARQRGTRVHRFQLENESNVRDA